ncbi:MAG: D-aminoacyl-tRNA deacylase [Candidatus Altiarchaeota archaeon]|nr:D-aminoacyl-tRNA deacylase [Candidatus Altiarchaeota archaeon]
MKLVAFSREDAAGSNIASILLKEFGLDDKQVMAFDKTMTNATFPQDFRPEVCIVASRHRSESGQPTLTAHVTGNFDAAELGGREKELAIAPALYLREAIRKLLLYGAGSGYSVSLEVTHHGPTSQPFPLLFVEVGSGPVQWNDLSACRIVARVISELLSGEPERVPVAVGFGGPHYAPNFTAVIEKVAVGHIASKHVIESIDESMLRQMVEKTVPKPDFALFDWKGLRGEERGRIAGMLSKMGLECKRTSEFKD